MTYDLHGKVYEIIALVPGIVHEVMKKGDPVDIGKGVARTEHLKMETTILNYSGKRCIVEESKVVPGDFVEKGSLIAIIREESITQSRVPLHNAKYPLLTQ